MATAQDYLQPLSPDQPAGSNCTYEACYSELTELVENSPSAEVLAEDKRWEQIRLKAETILRETSKHLTVGAYCAVAWLQENPLSGLGQGLDLLCGLMTTFGEALYPERPRARLNAVQWYLSNAAKALQKVPTFAPTADEAAAIQKSYDEFKRLFAEAFPEEVPPFHEMDRLIGTIVASVPAAVPEEGNAAAEGAAVAPAATEDAPAAAGQPGGQGTPAVDPVEGAFQKAQTMFARGETQKALQLMAAGMNSAVGGRDRLRWRINLCKLLLSCSLPEELVRVHIDETKKSVDDFKLAEWEPELAVAALEVVCAFWKKLGKDDRVNECLQQMALLNAAKAFAAAF